MSNISDYLVAHGGSFLFAVGVVEQAGLPLPAAPWLLAAGALSASGKLNPVVTLGLTTMASLIADTVWYYVGRRGGPRVLRLFCRLSLSKNSCLGKSKAVFAKRGLQGLVAAKFLPGLGTVMPPLAGALGLSARKFLLFDGLGSVLYGLVYLALGFAFHNQLEQVQELVKEFGFSLLMGGLVLIPAYIVFKYVQRNRAGTRRKQSEPGDGEAPPVNVASEYRRSASVAQPAPCEV